MLVKFDGAQLDAEVLEVFYHTFAVEFLMESAACELRIRKHQWLIRIYTQFCEDKIVVNIGCKTKNILIGRLLNKNIPVHPIRSTKWRTVGTLYTVGTNGVL